MDVKIYVKIKVQNLGIKNQQKSSNFNNILSQ